MPQHWELRTGKRTDRGLQEQRAGNRRLVRASHKDSTITEVTAPESSIEQATKKHLDNVTDEFRLIKFTLESVRHRPAPQTEVVQLVLRSRAFGSLKLLENELMCFPARQKEELEQVATLN